MKRSEAAKYARWSAAAALLLASLTCGVYLERKWVAHREKEKAPPSAPKDVTRLSSGLTFSKVDGKQTIFTVEASKSTDFKDKNATLIEDVKITIFGKTGERHDTIHTQSCQYEEVSGSIVCNGEVDLDLENPVNVARAVKNPGRPSGQTVHVETRGVTFHQSTGTAQTDQPVKFVFPGGNGEAIGIEYHSEAGELRLLRDVRLLLAPPGRDAATRKSTRATTEDALRVTGKSLDFRRDSRTMHLRGPVEAETRTGRLLAGELTLTLDAVFRAEKLAAIAGANGKKPELAWQAADTPMSLRAENLTAHLAPEGWLRSVEASGSVEGSRQSGKDEDEFSAESASLELLPKVSQPRELNLKGDVRLKTETGKAGNARVLETSALRVEFAERENGSKPKRAETLGAGSIEWADPMAERGTSGMVESPGTTRAKLRADKLEMEFWPEGRAKQLIATGNVRAERAAAGKPFETATAQNGVVQLLATGGWSEMDLLGDVKLTEGERSGQGDHAVFVRATETALLTGKAVARDRTTETQAPRITFSQSTGDIRAEGGVRSTDFSAKGSALEFAAVPANISADRMQANSKTGRAVYTGHARLWQGDSVMEADSIEFLRQAKVLNAVGNVRAVFPQASGPSAEAMAIGATPKKPKLWHVTAGTLTYRDQESCAHLGKNVLAQSAEQSMRGAAVDLYFTRGGTAIPKGPAAANPTGGAQQISRAVGTGGVIVEQGTRKAAAERGEYTAADGKFVMSGGNPTLYDASEGTTTGRQLTFFLADDTIIVDSENGSRTLTKHRVEK